jgi:CheY-like chemotaxis protein
MTRGRGDVAERPLVVLSTAFHTSQQSPQSPAVKRAWGRLDAPLVAKQLGRSTHPLLRRSDMTAPLDELISAFRCAFFPVQVLVVDDDVTSRAAMRRVLEHQGYSVIVAETALDALRVLERTHVPVDLLITDMQMPGMLGDVLAARVRESWPDMPIIFVSGEPGYARSSERAGGRVRFLLKPFLPTELLDAVLAVLELPAEEQQQLFGPMAELG